MSEWCKNTTSYCYRVSFTKIMLEIYIHTYFFRDSAIVLHYTYGAFVPLLKQIPWFTDTCKSIEAICFDPSATWLLVVCK